MTMILITVTTIMTMIRAMIVAQDMIIMSMLLITATLTTIDYRRIHRN